MAGLDETSKKILENLLVNGRLSARQISIQMGISTVTALSRIKKMEKDKVITGYSARLDDEKLGYTLTAVIEVVAKKNRLVAIEDRIASIRNVCAVYDITGSTDTLIVAKFKNREGLSSFVKGLSSIANVENTITHIVLNTVKEDFRIS